MSPKKTKLDIERAVAAAAAAQLLADPVVADDATTVSNVSDRGIYGRERDFDEEDAGAQVGAGNHAFFLDFYSIASRIFDAYCKENKWTLTKKI